MNEREIRILKDEINEVADRIEEVNEDNISEYDINDYDELTEIADELINKYDITLYYSPNAYLSDIDYLIDLLESKNEEEFYDNLQKYAHGMEEWAEREEDLYYDEILPQWIEGNINDIDNAEYIVKVFYIYPVWADGQLAEVVTANSEEEAEEIANKINDKMNVRTKVVKVDANTKEDIIREFAEDINRLTRNHHRYENLKISSYNDYEDEEEYDYED